MNKYLYILGLAGVALFSACSNSDDLSIVESPAIDEAKESALIYEAGQNSEVPITLGIGQSRGYTRAPLVTDVDEGYGNFSTEDKKYLGVFCLATDYQSSNHPIENDWSADDEAGLIVRMSNVPAKVEDGAVTFLDSDDLAEETPVETPKKWYYPMGNWMKYNFYTYYPRQEKVVDGNTTLSFSANQVLEKYYEIDGSQDIIWGMAVPPADDAFSAKYFRENVSAAIPQLKFEHKLVQFRFFVIATDDALAKKMKIANMYISNAVYRLSLIVANKTDEADTKNGQLNMLGDFKTDTLYIKKNGKNTNRFDGTQFFEINNTSVDVSSDTPVGYIMLARPDVAYEKKADYKYKLVVRVQYKDGTKTKYKNVPRFMTPPEGGFQEGKIYNIVVKVGLSGGIPN